MQPTRLRFLRSLPDEERSRIPWPASARCACVAADGGASLRPRRAQHSSSLHVSSLRLAGQAHWHRALPKYPALVHATDSACVPHVPGACHYLSRRVPAARAGERSDMESPAALCPHGLPHRRAAGPVRGRVWKRSLWRRRRAGTLRRLPHVRVLGPGNKTQPGPGLDRWMRA
jgi:hypothetical protein